MVAAETEVGRLDVPEDLVDEVEAQVRSDTIFSGSVARLLNALKTLICKLFISWRVSHSFSIIPLLDT